MLSNYKGREQSYIKHRFLIKYLQGAAYKIMQGHSRTFNFVDAFSGPWRVKDNDNFSDSSFDLALRTLNSVRENLTSGGLSDLHIRFCFCEKQKKAYTQLQRYAQQRKDFEIHVFLGDLENNLTAISDVLKDGFTFTFVDPTGWSIRNEEVFQFLWYQGGEILLNFMSDHINRHSGYDAVSKSIGRFLANPSWQEDFDACPTEWNNERKILYLLKRQMKKDRVAKFFPDFSIKLPRQKRVKMRLILGTNVSQGLELFRKI